jgi:hypothetical protein
MPTGDGILPQNIAQVVHGVLNHGYTGFALEHNASRLFGGTLPDVRPDDLHAGQHLFECNRYVWDLMRFDASYVKADVKVECVHCVSFQEG